MERSRNREAVRPKLIVGLGNPGPQYAQSRHNVGFQLIDRLAGDNGLFFARKQCKAIVASGKVKGTPVLLAKPLTYMNLSGVAVAGLHNFYKLRFEDILVAYDDLDLPLGRLRLRPGGGSGGHKGMESIIERLGSDQFARLRLGIGRPSAGDAVHYVLSGFSRDQATDLERIFDHATAAIRVWLMDGIDVAMNQYNHLSITIEEG